MERTIKDFQPQNESECLDLLQSPQAKIARNYFEEQYPVEYLAISYNQKELNDIIVKAVVHYDYKGTKHVTNNGASLSASEIALEALKEIIDDSVIGVLN